MDRVDTSKYKPGDKVCAVHFLPDARKQVMSVRQNGHLIAGAYLADKTYINNQRPHRNPKGKQRYIQSRLSECYIGDSHYKQITVGYADSKQFAI